MQLQSIFSYWYRVDNKYLLVGCSCPVDRSPSHVWCQTMGHLIWFTGWLSALVSYSAWQSSTVEQHLLEEKSILAKTKACISSTEGWFRMLKANKCKRKTKKLSKALSINWEISSLLYMRPFFPSPPITK